MTLPVNAERPATTGVLVPTRNCARLLRQNLADLKAVTSSADQVVVVDSNSCDGTLELLQNELKHRSIEFFDHPPGLYSSWNFGLTKLQTEYTYIATAGDTISIEGLFHLREVAERFRADLVLSNPELRTESGEISPMQWPIHRFLKARNINGPVELDPYHFFLTSVFFGLAGFMGSSASNLYRTKVMQARPFPTDFGHVGDTGWAVTNAFGVKAALTPRICAKFVLHGDGSGVAAAEAPAIEDRLLARARTTVQECCPPAEANELFSILDDFNASRRELPAAQRNYTRLWKSPFPWYLNPSAWAARKRRNFHRRRTEEVWPAILDRFSKAVNTHEK